MLAHHPFASPDKHLDFIFGNSEMAALIRLFDWSNTSLGPLENWPAHLRYAINYCLMSSFPVVLYCGAESVFIYNDAFIPIAGSKHPHKMLGLPAKEARQEVWPELEPLINEARATQQIIKKEDGLQLLNRTGFLEECYITSSFKAIGLNEKTSDVVAETLFDNTTRVIDARYSQTLKALGMHATEAKSVADTCQRMTKILEENAVDIPFALLYLFDTARQQAILQGTTRLAPETAISPAILSLAKSATTLWPLASMVDTDQLVIVDTSAFPPLPAGGWKEVSKKAALIPLLIPGEKLPIGVLIAGTNPHRAIDEECRHFYQLMASFISASILNARAYQKERQRAEEDAYRHQEQFVDTLCHELRNPLNGIYGHVGLLATRQALTEKRLREAKVEEINPLFRNQLLQSLAEDKEAVEAINACAKYQKVITDDVFHLSKLEAGKVTLHEEMFDPKNIIKNVVAMVDANLNAKKLQLYVKLPYKELCVKGDPNRLAQVLLNLLTNAIKFTPEQGSITLSADQLIQTADQTILQFNVEDTGVGLTPEEQAQLFNRFAQVNRRTSQDYEGSGLGLAISKKLVELMGGEITLKSEKWKGSKFNFTVTCKTMALEEKQAVVPHSVAKSKIISARNFIILIVEDNRINQKMLTKQLELEGYDCHVANNGQEAVDLFKKIPINFVFMDIEMPVMNGLEATKTLRALEKESQWRRPPVPIVGLSAYVRPEQREEALSAGMDDYLTKPFERPKLLERLEHFRKKQTSTTLQMPSALSTSSPALLRR